MVLVVQNYTGFRVTFVSLSQVSPAQIRGGYRVFQKGGLRPAIRNAGGGGGGGGVLSALGPIRKAGGWGGGGGGLLTI